MGNILVWELEHLDLSTGSVAKHLCDTGQTSSTFWTSASPLEEWSGLFRSVVFKLILFLVSPFICSLLFPLLILSHFYNKFKFRDVLFEMRLEIPGLLTFNSFPSLLPILVQEALVKLPGGPGNPGLLALGVLMLSHSMTQGNRTQTPLIKIISTYPH